MIEISRRLKATIDEECVGFTLDTKERKILKKIRPEAANRVEG